MATAYLSVAEELTDDGLDSPLVRYPMSNPWVPVRWVDEEAKKRSGLKDTKVVGGYSPDTGEVDAPEDPQTAGEADTRAHELRHHENDIDPNNDLGQCFGLLSEWRSDYTSFFLAFLKKKPGATMNGFFKLKENPWLFSLVHALDEADAYLAGAAAAEAFKPKK